MTNRQTESDAYEPTMHKHRCAQKWRNFALMWAHLPFFGTLIWPWPMWPLTLTHVTFHLDARIKKQKCNLTLKWAHLPMTLRLATSQDWLADLQLAPSKYLRTVLEYCGQVSSYWLLYFLRYEFMSSLNFGQVTDRQTTDRKHCIRALRKSILGVWKANSEIFSGARTK